MIKIYEIPSDKFSAVKAILETPEKETGKTKAKIEMQVGKTERSVEEFKEWKINEFKRQGYLLRDAKSLGFEEAYNYLYIDASENFFERNEKTLIDAGARELKEEKFEKVREKIKAGEEAAAESMGAIFG